MPADFTAFVDLPVELAADTDGTFTKRIQIAEIGRFKDPRYGTFQITAKDVDSWRRLLDSYFHGERPIDFDHNTDKDGPTGSKAGAWIKTIEQDGTKVMASVEFTPAGLESVRNKEYRYISPTFVGDLKDERGRSLGPALLRAAFTNNPFLQGMPAIALSGATLAERVGSADPADSRPAMPDLTKIAEALKLDADADETTVLSAVTDLRAKADEPPKTLEAQAREAGKVLLDADEHGRLKGDAAAKGALEERVKTLESDAANEKFDGAYTLALDEGRVDAKDETKTEWRELYDLAPAPTLKRLAALPKVVNLASGHRREVDLDDDDDERVTLHKRAEAYALEHKVDYSDAVLAVVEEVEA